MTKISRFIVLLFISLSLKAQNDDTGILNCSRAKTSLKSSKLRLSKLSAQYPGDVNIDVKYHDINLKINPTNQSINGEVKTLFTTNKSTNQVVFDLNTIFKVDSVLEGNVKLNFTHANNLITITFPSVLATNSDHIVTIFYNGKPSTSGYGSFTFGTHNSTQSAIWSLSEPYGAPDWWPCKDDLLDKIDSTRMRITLPNFYTSVSNGVLESKTQNPDSTSTFVWFNDTKIAHYLISIACSNYQLFENYFTYPEGSSDSMKLQHFYYPEQNTTAVLNMFRETVDMLHFFSDKFGRYPFYYQKYGHASCGFGGGMEHQTISSMGGYSQNLVAHELAHQWFGDKITCATWQDIWLNEGFATYLAILYDENKRGNERYKFLIQQRINDALNARGSIYVEDIGNIFEIFDGPRSYSKGSLVLHMLRGILGDDEFYSAINDYINSDLAFGTATTEQFKNSIEKSTGLELDYFFNEWIYSKNNHPIYQYSYEILSDNSIRVDIFQEEQTLDPFYKFYDMPIPIELVLVGNTSITQTVRVDKASQSFIFDNLPAGVTKVNFDPENWVFKEASTSEVPLSLVLGDFSNEDFLIFPSPANDVLNLNYNSSNFISIQLFNSAGIIIEEYMEPAKSISIRNYPTGSYFLRINKKKSSYAKSFIKQ